MDVPPTLAGWQGVKQQPSHWLAAVIDTLAANGKAPFKVIGTEFGGAFNGVTADRVRILNKDTGAVWSFTCFEERPPA